MAMANIIKKICNDMRMKSMRRDLSTLSDGELNDLGIHRGQIPDLARYFYGAGPRPDSI
ncbi:MAG: hypothetical protein CMM46_12305 [Rhodospirillaceae bacterium]|nr:hypothetical protein [Rhodospirillaceae bacterium]|tara:strand:- start:15045 stop:15221 length:177 start_codon:yes stop_codon:yes gene_type:complete